MSYTQFYMIQYLAIQGPRIRWRINADSPDICKLKSLDVYYLINPYQFSIEYKDKNLLIGEHHSLINGDCLIQTSGIILKTIDDVKIDYEILSNKLNDFFRYLRFESMQVDIQSNNSVFSILIHDKITKGVIDIPKISEMFIRSDYYFSTITWDNIRNADNNLANKKEIPIYEEILLDAHKSMLENEYNQVILFSVIAIESLLAHKYSDSYEFEKSRKIKRKDLRLIKNHDETYNDPILKSLLNGTDFKKLLHEIPLYLYKKSILCDNQSLYNNLLKLYTTRNKIVHWGGPLEIDNSKMFDVNEESAKIAIKSANEVFNWIGINRYDKLLKKKFVTI